MEALYSKLYDKYTKLKTRKDNAMEELNREQEMKFMKYMSAADDLIEHLRSERDTLRAEVSELRSEVASIRYAKDEQYIEYQKLLLEENQKYKELSEEIERLRSKESHSSSRDDRSDNGQLNISGASPITLDETNRSTTRKRSRNFRHDNEVLVTPCASDPHEHAPIGESVINLSKQPISNCGTLTDDQPKCCRGRVGSSEDVTDSPSCIFQELAECLVDLKFSIASQTDEIFISAVHESSDINDIQRRHNLERANREMNVARNRELIQQQHPPLTLPGTPFTERGKKGSRAASSSQQTRSPPLPPPSPRNFASGQMSSKRPTNDSRGDERSSRSRGNDYVLEGAARDPLVTAATTTPVSEPSLPPSRSEGSSQGGQASWLKRDFVMPTSKDEVRSLIDELAAVPQIGGLNLLERGNLAAACEKGLVKQLVHTDLVRNNQDVSNDIILGEIGLILSELATKVTLLYNRANDNEDLASSLDEERRKLEDDVRLLKEDLQAKDNEVLSKIAELGKLGKDICSLKSQVEFSQSRVVELLKQIDDEKLAAEQREKILREGLSRDAEARKRAIIEEFKVSPEFEELADANILLYYNHGVNHVLRMVASSCVPEVTPEMMAVWGAASPWCSEARASHALVPYNWEELEFIVKDDRENEQREWVPPTPLPDNVVVRMDAILEAS